MPALHPIDVDTTSLPFASLGLDPRLLEGTRDLGWKDTRPIQSAVIPLALANQDLIACAETGSGKTAAFVVPTLQRLLLDHAKNIAAEAESGLPRKSRVLVLAPTRELAVQIEDEIHGLAYHTTVTSAAVYGGVEMGMQERALKAGVDIIVATPGAADGSHAAAERGPERHRAAGPRRSRSHDGHGLLARRAPHHHRDAGRAPDAAVLGDDAERSGARRAGDHARREICPGRTAQRAGQEHHAPRRSGGGARQARTG